MKAYQQGDVLILQATAIPEGAKPVKPGTRGHVLAEGEHTGHAHTMEATEAVELFVRDGVLWLRVGEGGATVTHEEHRAQTVAPGVYKIRRVVEVDPFENEIRTVAD